MKKYLKRLMGFYRLKSYGKIIINNERILQPERQTSQLFKYLMPSGNSILLKISVCFFIILLTTIGLSFVDLSYDDIPVAGDVGTLEDDEIMKQHLLSSPGTDYSYPEEKAELVTREHIVKKGETLSQISAKYEVSMNTICGFNNLRSYHLLRHGQRLNIPNKEGILKKIQKGDKLLAIAKKYKTPVNRILDENNIKNPDFININTVLFLPDAKPLNIMPSFLWPVSSRRITSSYGWRRHPIKRRRHFHQGMDIGSVFQSVRATKHGRVTYAGWLGGYGRVVILAHPGGWKSLYGHLSRIRVRRGQHVKQGQRIAISGNTGLSTGPHLHFEMLKNGRSKNPGRYLK